MDNDIFVAFLIGVVLLIIGMGLFTLGAENSMSNIGERVGADFLLCCCVCSGSVYTGRLSCDCF